MTHSRFLDLDGLDGVLGSGALARATLRSVAARSPAGAAAAALGVRASRSPALPTGGGQNFVTPMRPVAPVAVATDDYVPLDDEQPTLLAKRPASVPPTTLEEPAAEIRAAPLASRRIAAPVLIALALATLSGGL